MTPTLLAYLCDPHTHATLRLRAARTDAGGRIVEGDLVSEAGVTYPIRQGIPRFVPDAEIARSVAAFGHQWNYFNFAGFREQWRHHTVRHTFGSPEVFRGRVIVDAGAGSGAQGLWMLEAGARHVLLLELSGSVDDVVLRNLEPSGYRNWDVIQCSIDAPPIRPGSIDGLVICHNVIQHTPSVARTAAALWALVAPGGEFVFNCYHKNDRPGLLRWLRFHAVYRSLRAILRRAPFHARLAYAQATAGLRLVPGLGRALELAGLCVQGQVVGPEGRAPSRRQRFRATALNTFDAYGGHRYQHHLSEAEFRALIRTMQPDPSRVENLDRYFQRPPPIGCAERLHR